MVFAGEALVVGRNAGGIALADPGRILVVKASSGAVAASLTTPAEVVDLLALG
jgi:hypothetical protein